MKTAPAAPGQGAHCAGMACGPVDLPAVAVTEAAAKGRPGVARR